MERTFDTTRPSTTGTLLPTTGRILVASDGTHDADGAVRVGLALARRDNIQADLFSVVEPLTLFTPDGVPLPADTDDLVDITRESREAALLAQRDRTHPAIREWPFDIAIGPRVETIVANAERRRASLVLLGLGAHGVSARLMQRETALRVIRAASIPVLALPSDAWGVPHTALAAVDFTASSEHAARTALSLLGREGTLYLAHVTPHTPIPQGDPRTWEEFMRTGITPKLVALARGLEIPPEVRVEYVLLHGEPAHELLAFAEERRIDMIATGAHGRSALGRFMLGSVSTTLVRKARCWVLVAPADRDAPQTLDDTAAPNVWS
jgi:nucleotide-binding universal stress UspA family protein